MPRYKQRFADLERQLRKNGGVGTPGTELGNYAEYKAGKRKAERRKTTPLTAEQRERYGVSLAAFNLDFPAAHSGRYIASITNWSNSIRVTYGLGDAVVGHDKQTLDGVTAIGEDAFYPALLRLSVPIAGLAATTPKSGITGNEYKYVSSNAYSIPFGRIDAGSSEEERRKLLALAAKGGTPKPRSVGYDPEVFRGIKAPLEEAPE